jgi:hypothetical protein
VTRGNESNFHAESTRRRPLGNPFAVRRSVVRSENAPCERGGTSFEDYTAKDKSQWERELTERISVEALKVYHLTIQENGHSRRFVYEDRDQALTRLADAIAAGLDARLDEVVRDAAGVRYSSLASSPSSTVEKSHGRANGIGTPAG